MLKRYLFGSLSVCLLIFCMTPIVAACEQDSKIVIANSDANTLLIQATHEIIDPYASLSVEEFCDSVHSLMHSRTDPYIEIEGNHVYFGDVGIHRTMLRGREEKLYEGKTPYIESYEVITPIFHGIHHIVWHNNQLFLHPLWNICIGMREETLLEAIRENDIAAQHVEDTYTLSAIESLPFGKIEITWSFALRCGTVDRIEYQATLVKTKS